MKLSSTLVVLAVAVTQGLLAVAVTLGFGLGFIALLYVNVRFGRLDAHIEAQDGRLEALEGAVRQLEDRSGRR